MLQIMVDLETTKLDESAYTKRVIVNGRDSGAQKARIDEVICVGCGICADICPQGAIMRECRVE